MIDRGLSVAGPFIDAMSEGDEPEVIIPRGSIMIRQTQYTPKAAVRTTAGMTLPLDAGYVLEIDGPRGTLLAGAADMDEPVITLAGDNPQGSATGRGVWVQKEKGHEIGRVAATWQLDLWPATEKAGPNDPWFGTMLITFEDEGTMLVLHCGPSPDGSDRPGTTAKCSVWDKGAA